MSDLTNEVTTTEPVEQANTTTDSSERTFTQADLDRIVTERVQRVENKYEDYANLKATADEFSVYKNAEQERLEKAKEEAQEALRAEMTSTNVKDKALGHIRYEAKGTFADPDDAILHLKDRLDEFVSDDGSLNETALNESLTDLLTSKPHLAAKTNSSGSTLSDVGLGRTGVSTPPATNADRFAAFFTESIQQ